MSAAIDFLLNHASAAQIAHHLSCCDADFVPPLSGRIEIRNYAQKIASEAIRFEAWSEATLVGMVAAYCNDRVKSIAYITSASVLRAWMRKGIAVRLVGQCVDYAKASGMRQITLEVAVDNTPAIKLYEKCGFIVAKASSPFIGMGQYLEGG